MRLLRGPKAVADAAQAIVCVGLALEAEIAENHFETQVCTSTVSDLAEIADRSAMAGCRGIVSFGLAGGLSPQLRSGDIVVASEIVGQNGSLPTDDIWSGWLLSAIPAAYYAPVAGVDSAVLARAARGELGVRSGAIVVDTESHVIARFAAAQMLRFVAIRVVIDAAHRRVPPAALACVSGDGVTRMSRLARLLLERPVDAFDILRLCADWWSARSALITCCEILGASACEVNL